MTTTDRQDDNGDAKTDGIVEKVIRKRQTRAAVREEWQVMLIF
jgi:hypothetical protein